MATADAPPTRPRFIAAIAISGAVGLVLGYGVLLVVTGGIALMWETIPQTWETTPAWYIVSVLLIAAGLVFVVRRYVGDSGHSPLAGIKITGLTPKEYVGAILAILASLFGGAVLGPEVALVATGSVVGGLVAKLLGCLDPQSAKRIVGVGALGAILALFVGPLLAGSMSLDGASTTIDLDDVGWAIPVAIIATFAITLARLLGALIMRAGGPGPSLRVLMGAALVIALAAIALEYVSDQRAIYVVTSGEELITELPKLTSVSTVVAILIFKSLAYAVSLGAGFRGGPFFPAMFLGAAAGLLISLLIPNGPSVPAAMTIGVVASVIATAKMSWPIAIVLGLALGFAMGGWALIPSAVVAALIARAVPRWGDRIVAAQSQDVQVGR